MTDPSPSLKRKFIEGRKLIEGWKEQQIFVLLNSAVGPKAAAVYCIESENSGNGMGFFYDQKFCGKIGSVAATVLGNHLYLFPSDMDALPFPCYDLIYEDITRLKPSVFDLISSTICQEDVPLPKARKFYPIVTVIGKKIFAFSAYVHPFQPVPEPCFECLDLADISGTGWSKLCRPPFINDLKERMLQTTGYVVLEDSFILVCLGRNEIKEEIEDGSETEWVPLQSDETEISFSLFNIQSNRWETVWVPPQASSTELKPLFYLDREAVAFGHDIYTYHVDSKKLFVLTYTKGSSDSISFENGNICLVEGLTFAQSVDHYKKSGAIAKLEDRMLCVLHTAIFPVGVPLPICVSIIQLVDRDHCNTLKYFTCALNIEKKLSAPVIHSCHIMNLKETSDHRPSKRVVNDNKSSEMEFDCGGTLKLDAA